MHDGTEDLDAEYAIGRAPGRMYVSSRFDYQGESPDDPLNGRAARFGYTVQDATGHVEVFDDRGWELVVRETPTRQQLKALFLEDPRTIKTLFFQRFSADGRRIARESFTLHGEEVGSVLAFLDALRSQGLTLLGPGGMRFSPELLRQLVGDSGAISELARQNPHLLEEIIRSEVSVPDVVALARRQRVLREFRDMLYDADVFASARARYRGPERAWQKFFEANPWIVGGSLAPQFLHSLDRDRLEQVIRGSSLVGAGKRADAVLRTAGALSAIVLVEIKQHETKLLDKALYRPDCWSVGEEVAGGVAQCQVTADWAEKDLGPLLEVRDGDGYTIDRVAVCRPRSILVVGSLEQFQRDGQLNRPMYESFERFRRSLRDPEIVTFDEMYQRASTMLALTADAESHIAEDLDTEIAGDGEDLPF